MDPDILKAKLESLSRCLLRIEGRIPGDPESLRKDLDTQDIIVLNLERAVQLCVDMGSHILSDHEDITAQTMAQVFLLLGEKKILSSSCVQNLVRAVGFRNIAVHEYNELDWDIVYHIAKERIADFREFGRSVLEVL